MLSGVLSVMMDLGYRLGLENIGQDGLDIDELVDDM
jgi:hypothetical protein